MKVGVIVSSLIAVNGGGAINWTDVHPEHALDDKFAVAEDEANQTQDLDSFRTAFGGF